MYSHESNLVNLECICTDLVGPTSYYTYSVNDESIHEWVLASIVLKVNAGTYNTNMQSLHIIANSTTS